MQLTVILGDIGGIMILDDFRATFPSIDAMSHPDIHTVTLTGTTIASWNLGCLVGAILTFFLCHVLGRKGCIIVGLSIEIVGKMIQCTSFTLGQYIAGRVVAGVGNGYELTPCLQI
jgi:MFS family permease